MFIENKQNCWKISAEKARLPTLANYSEMLMFVILENPPRSVKWG